MKVAKLHNLFCYHKMQKKSRTSNIKSYVINGYILNAKSSRREH